MIQHYKNNEKPSIGLILFFYVLLILVFKFLKYFQPNHDVFSVYTSRVRKHS